MHLACTLLNYVGFGASTFEMGKAERQHSWGLQKVLQELHGYMQPNNVSANYYPISYNMAIIITLQPELNPKSMRFILAVQDICMFKNFTKLFYLNNSHQMIQK